jgi:hypothetical protein
MTAGPGAASSPGWIGDAVSATDPGSPGGG